MNQWARHWDNFNDLPYWINSISNEESYVEPSTIHYLPSGWIPPVPPQWMINEKSGELLSPRSLNQKEQEAAAFLESEMEIILEDNS